jgi:hypothetical protein
MQLRSSTLSKIKVPPIAVNAFNTAVAAVDALVMVIVPGSAMLAGAIVYAHDTSFSS